MADGAPAAEPYVLSMLVMPAQANTLGVMHGGHMMSWMDMAAWVVAARAVVPEQAVFFKAVDDCIWSGPVHAGEVCHVTARLAGVGRSSLRVRLEARAEDPVRKEMRDVCRAEFTMVAAQDGAPVPVRLHRAG
jgi:acyl-CoA thioesterase YciA